MEMSPLKLAAAAAFAAAIGFGGVSIASAQEDPTTTVPSTQDDGTTDDGATDDENCPHGDDADASAETTSA
jgi:hypothetical protein